MRSWWTCWVYCGTISSCMCSKGVRQVSIATETKRPGPTGVLAVRGDKLPAVTRCWLTLPLNSPPHRILYVGYVQAVLGQQLGWVP